MGIIHRDVCVENMMYYLDVEGNIIGVLEDYDSATLRAEQHNGQAFLKQKTGTRPYMAKELLECAEPPAHLFRYDLESIMYSFLDLACYRHASLEIQRASPIHEWFDQESSGKAIANSKAQFLITPTIPVTTQGMEELTDVVSSLYDMFSAAHLYMGGALLVQLRTGKKFDLVTIDGHVTLDAFAAIFGT
ncbi:hypothetical protein D9619_011831 [Psilocybe cf. subviscida]|uniref:Protein kinase domain-containing protein n=1 Tax=Psilocybe cf. subviscida TaxID=2480587 RepID=A0A8H5B0N4_9AGAR|nr:hypothetical protein D9619_011831 [Psilocybe cf. subviscida]